MDQPTTPARYQKFERLVDLSRLLNQGVELESFLQAVSNYICELTLSEAGSVLVLEEETGLLKFLAAPRNHMRTLKRIRVPVDNSAAGRAFSTGRNVILQEPLSDGVIYRSVDKFLQFHTRSILAVPIRYGSHILGVMEAVNKLNNVQYTDDDVTILETLAIYAGIFLFTHALIDEVEYNESLMEQVEKNKSDFIAITAHELRTPLGLIMGHASMLQETIDDAEAKNQVSTILKSALRLKEIIEQTSALAVESNDKQRLRRQTVVLRKLIRDVVQSFKEAASLKGINLEANLPDESLQIPADTEKIAITLGNLVDNAINFTDPGGRVLVITEVIQGFVKISVLDTGIGIPTKDLPKIFDRFYQVESHFTRKIGGLGLGLSVAKVMVDLHGGQIWAESVESKGSNFSFLLPLK
jgi:signal transduction histidine kinase